MRPIRPAPVQARSVSPVSSATGSTAMRGGAFGSIAARIGKRIASTPATSSSAPAAAARNQRRVRGIARVEGATARRCARSRPAWRRPPAPPRRISTTSATQSSPRPCTVRITRCASPSSPSARRALRSCCDSAASVTGRPPHSALTSSVLVSARPRASSRSSIRSKTFASTSTRRPARRISRAPRSISTSSKR